MRRSFGATESKADIDLASVQGPGAEVPTNLHGVKRHSEPQAKNLDL